MTPSTKLGFSGALAQRFQNSKITPLLALTGLLMGLFAVAVTPREEEPQINVTFANIFVPFPGASPVEVENIVAIPLEQVLAEIEGVKHTYSVSRPGMAVLTIQYEVGEDRTSAIVRLYNAVYSNEDWLPPGSGVMRPLIKPKGIDDVPTVTVTLWTEDESRGAHELQRVAHALEAEIKRVPGTRDVYTIGGPDNVVHVLLDPQRMAAYGLSLDALRNALRASNVVSQAGAIVANNQQVPVTAGAFLADRYDVADLVIGVVDGKAIHLSDVATISAGPDQPEQYVRFGDAPAVTIAVAKKPGTNAARVSAQVIERIASLDGIVIPEGVEYTITRDYGKTADDKAKKLIQKLAFATISVIFLIYITLGWREAVVVGSAVIITLTLTLFASWAWGFTINRVSLFSLIFSIGILVDDAIVVVENIHRHMAMGDRTLFEAIPPAVDEVGGPTILATFTVIAALLPMAFVTGLMGPYMSPIPINASTGMLISLAVALVLTPWLSHRLLQNAPIHKESAGEKSRLHRTFDRLMRPFLDRDTGKRARAWLYGGTVAIIGVAMLLVVLQFVVLKMLPFDNKSEFQVIVDMPEGTSIEQTSRVLDALSEAIERVPEVTDYQVYAGTASPINFNGLVRQYYLRSDSNTGDIQVNLVDKHHRKRSSHEIARSVRDELAAIGDEFRASVKVVEVPPGPPVMSPIVAEIYGPDYAAQKQLGRNLEQVFRGTPDISDIDSTVEADARRYVIQVDRQRAALLGVSQTQVSSSVAM